MKRIVTFQQKLLLVLVVAILFVCFGFIFISCGKGPQSKIADPDKGAYALDFTKCESASTCRALMEMHRSIADKDLTIEAWVKSKASNPNDFTGGIFGHFDTAGIILYAKNGVPKAAIRRVGASGTATATADYIVSSGMQIVDHVWHHIAAVLTGEDHSAVHADCGSTDPANKTDAVNCPLPGTVCNNDIHLDIYVDGVYKECNTTYGESNDTTVTSPEYTKDPNTDFESVGVFAEGKLKANNMMLDGIDDSPDPLVTFPGVIDEPRLWGIARTQDQINQCKSRELSLDSGTCGRMTNNLLSYLRFNEGTGATINDWTGLGTGVLEDVITGVGQPPWTTGWTTDSPGLERND
jgi:hypothetical protein